MEERTGFNLKSLNLASGFPGLDGNSEKLSQFWGVLASQTNDAFPFLAAQSDKPSSNFLGFSDSQYKVNLGEGKE
jgi:hypothetical protein